MYHPIVDFIVITLLVFCLLFIGFALKEKTKAYDKLLNQYNHCSFNQTQ